MWLSLLDALRKVNKGEELLLMSISLRDFFLDANSDYAKLIIDLIKRGVTMRVLLLDPTSESAYHRAFLEQKRINEYNYTDSALFKAIRDVAEFLANPNVGYDELPELIKNQIQVRFYPYDPTTHLIIGEDFTIVEH